MTTQPGRPRKKWSYNYQDLRWITGRSVKSIQAARENREFMPTDLESVLLWCATYARPELKEDIRQSMCNIAVEVDAKTRTRPRPELPDADCWYYYYEDLAKVTGKSENAIQASRRRPGGFEPSELESVLIWCSRNARADLKDELFKRVAQS